jgi:diguanylate cyclase (GGDEF)-like protein
MDVTQDILLPVLFAAIIANTVLLVLVVVASRTGRHRRVGESATRSALQGSLLSTSFVDSSGSSAWGSEIDSSAGAGAVEPSGERPDGAPADAVVEGHGLAAVAATDHAARADPADPAADSADPAAGADPPAEADATAPQDPGAVVDENAGVDALTGLIGPGAFSRLVAAENARLQRYHRPATVVIFELGGLDRLIDRLGTDAADRIVPAMADTMSRLGRDVDDVARLAPGRFGVLLPETDEVAAINYVERVRRACELWLESGAIALSLAIGWAGTTGDPSLIEAQRLATDRMYAELRREARRAVER